MADGRFGALVEGYAAALRQEIGALADGGRHAIKWMSPTLESIPGTFVLFARSMQTLAARKGQARLAVSFYFGDATPLYERLQRLPVDILGFDFTYSPQLVELIATQAATSAGFGISGWAEYSPRGPERGGAAARKNHPSSIRSCVSQSILRSRVPARRPGATEAAAPQNNQEHVCRGRPMSRTKLRQLGIDLPVFPTTSVGSFPSPTIW